MHVWQSDRLGNISLTHEMTILFCYCLGPFVVRSSKNEKVRNCFSQYLSQISKDFSFQYSILELSMPTKTTFYTYLSGMRPLARISFKSSKTWCAEFFRMPWGKLKFLITIRPSLKSFEDIRENSQLENIS